jgi:hypothetical protein
MIITTYRRLRNIARRIVKPARLAFIAWLDKQADAEIQRMRDAREDSIKYEQRQQLRKVELSIQRNHIEKGIA